MNKIDKNRIFERYLYRRLASKTAKLIFSIIKTGEKNEFQ